MEMCGRLGTYILEFITAILETGEKSASRPGLFTLMEIFPSIHYTGGCECTTSLDAVEKT
jgi:hypothetical protein